MKRFYHERNHRWIGVLFSVFLFLLLFSAFSHSISGISKETASAQEETLRLALSRSITHCYASEGRYPESLSYLLEHYDIFYDEDLFFIDYQILGENIFPDVTIIRKQEP